MSVRIFDAHLDLAMNAILGRDVRRPAREQKPYPNEIPTVGLPDLRAGNVTHVCATIFCEPSIDGKPGYRNAEEAYAQAMQQLQVYDDWHQQGLFNRITNVTAGSTNGAINALTLLEGADAVRTPADLQTFYNRGVRIIGLAWQQTRYAGGSGAPGPLTAEGRAIVPEIDRVGMIHDISHLADESFWNLLDLTDRPVIASHSNCRSIVEEDPRQRNITDDMIRAIAARSGVVGMVMYDRFLMPHAEHGKRRATLADVVAHVRRVCELTGSDRHVALGTDMDGGLGREQIPVEIETSADLPRVGDALRNAGFADDAVDRILFGNWHAFFAKHLG